MFILEFFEGCSLGEYPALANKTPTTPRLDSIALKVDLALSQSVKFVV